MKINLIFFLIMCVVVALTMTFMASMSGTESDNFSLSDASDGALLSVSVFFNNSELDSNYACDNVFPVQREVSTATAIKDSVRALLRGVTVGEESSGYFSSINSNVSVNRVDVYNGVAYVDLSEEFELNVRGACRVAGITAQLHQTLKQFSGVENVVVSVNGRQPLFRP